MIKKYGDGFLGNNRDVKKGQGIFNLGRGIFKNATAPLTLMR